MRTMNKPVPCFGCYFMAYCPYGTGKAKKTEGSMFCKAHSDRLASIALRKQIYVRMAKAERDREMQRLSQENSILRQHMTALKAERDAFAGMTLTLFEWMVGNNENEGLAECGIYGETRKILEKMYLNGE